VYLFDRLGVAPGFDPRGPCPGTLNEHMTLDGRSVSVSTANVVMTATLRDPSSDTEIDADISTSRAFSSDNTIEPLRVERAIPLPPIDLLELEKTTEMA